MFTIKFSIFCVCVFFAIWWTLVNTVLWQRGKGMPARNFFLQAIGITGWVLIQGYIGLG